MEVTQYHNLIPFFVNSKIYTISIHGEGVPLLLDLVNPSDRFIDLGSTTTGKSVSRTVKVINNSVVPIDVKFDIWNRLQYVPKTATTLEPEFDLEEHVPIIYEEKEEPSKVKGKKKGKKDSAKGKKGKGRPKSKKASKSKSSKKSNKSPKTTKSSASSKKSKKGKGKKEVEEK